MIQKQKPPVRVGEGEQPEFTAKAIEVPLIDDLAEKMKEAAQKQDTKLVCYCGVAGCRQYVKEGALGYVVPADYNGQDAADVLAAQSRAGIQPGTKSR